MGKTNKNRIKTGISYRSLHLLISANETVKEKREAEQLPALDNDTQCLMSTGKVHILNADYSRYGVSVYDKLYGYSSSAASTIEEEDKGSGDGFKKRYMSLMQGSSQWKSRKLKQKKNAPKASAKAKAFLVRLHSEKRRHEVDFADINCLPEEIICRIIANLNDADSQRNCLLVSQEWSECAKRIIYKDVKFTSTYRVGQFVTTLRENPQYGKYVESLDLSQLKNGFINDESSTLENDVSQSSYGFEPPDIAYAGWRDWRYRKNSLYGSEMLSSIHRSRTRRSSDASSMNSSVFSHNYNRTRSSSVTSLVSRSTQTAAGSKNVVKRIRKLFSNSFRGKGQQKTHLHQNNGSGLSTLELKDEQFAAGTDSCSLRRSHLPFTNKFFLKYAHLRDLPLGYIIHLLTLCVNLKSINLSNLSLSPDFEIEELEYKRNGYVSFFPEETEEENLNGLNTVNGDRELTPKFFSDSDKPYHYYKDTQYESIIWKLDSSRDNNMFTNRRRSRKKFQLKILTNDDLCEAILSLKHMKHLNVGNVVWLMQRDMKRLIVHSMESCIIEDRCLDKIYMNFEGSGLQTNLPLAGQGLLKAMVLLQVITDMTNNCSDDQILEWFELRWIPTFRRVSQPADLVYLARACDQLHYVIQSEESPTYTRVGEVLITESHTGHYKYEISRNVNNGYLTIQIENGKPDTITDVKLKECSDRLLERVSNLRKNQLLQHTGENFFSTAGLA